MSRLDRALIIRKPYIDQILSRRKTWEIRGSRTMNFGAIGLVQKGSGHVVGTCDLVQVIGPLSLAEFKKNAAKIGVSQAEIRHLPYPKTYAWVLRGARRFARPRPYLHRSGSVRWATISMRG